MYLHTLDTLLEAMLKATFYPHPVATIHVIHTHISIVILTGSYAYKIKKPVNFGFVDFTHLADRKHFCDEELRLNSRLAPGLYLEVVPILLKDGVYMFTTASSDSKEFIVEYAVKMRQFDPSQQFDCLLTNGFLPIAYMDTLTQKIAVFHEQAEKAPNDSPYGQPNTVLQPMLDNFVHLRTHLLSNQSLGNRLSLLENWTEQEYKRLQIDIVQRKKAGHIRACHGDMHLGNIALIGKEITIFDGIEFSESLRWIDTANELAFLLMDLEDRQSPAYAQRVLNGYLSASGDYELLKVLNFYKVYRAIVRAKVHALRLSQLPDEPLRQQELTTCLHYLSLAEHYLQHPQQQPCLVITHGVSGSGKSYACKTLVEQGGFIQLRSDIERKRLYQNQHDPQMALYDSGMTAYTYEHLALLSKQLLPLGYSVVVDATFLQQAHRQIFQQLAQQLSAPFLILTFRGSVPIYEHNITQRQQAGNDVSDADIAVLHQQLKQYTPLQDNEPYVTVHANAPIPLAQIQAQLGRL